MVFSTTDHERLFQICRYNGIVLYHKNDVRSYSTKGEPFGYIKPEQISYLHIQPEHVENLRKAGILIKATNDEYVAVQVLHEYRFFVIGFKVFGVKTIEKFSFEEANEYMEEKHPNCIRIAL